jgi:hypothetical protein
LNVQTSVFWRVSFGIVAVSGVVIMALVRGFPVAPQRDGTDRRALVGADRIGLAAYAAAIVLYVLIGVLAVRGGLDALRTEAVLQVLLVFLGFNVAWLLLLDDTRPARPWPHAGAE